MSEYPDHDRVRDLLKRIDEITRESEALRRRIEQIRDTSPEWPDRRRSHTLEAPVSSGSRDRSS